VQYKPGELKVVAYKNGKKWAENQVRTTDVASRLIGSADRDKIQADGKDLAFITVRVADKDRLTVPHAKNQIRFKIEGPGEIVATDNGDPTNFTPFSSHNRDAFNGLCLAIVRGLPGQPGTIRLIVESGGLESTTVTVKSEGGR
jgi:beta-galactosidase